MRDLRFGDEPALGMLRYRNAARGGGTSTARLAIEVARAGGFPDAVAAIVVASDLQGIAVSELTGQPTLLGVAVAEYLERLADQGALAPLQHVGVILAGDLYSVPGADKRGGHGDVAPVWSAFAERCAWVVGVAGNHDDVSAIDTSERVVVLDGDQVELDGLRVGGVGRIIGNPGKLGRRAEADQLAHLAAAADGADVLILHEGPHGTAIDQRGNPLLREAITDFAVPLTICGHDHWASPLATFDGGQILNVDARVIVVTAGA